MVMNDTLSAALSKILNAERIGRKECTLAPVSKVLKRILEIMNQNLYIGKYEELDDGRGGMLKVHLLGTMNKCGSVKPRFSTKVTEMEKWEKRYLPAQGFGILILSTSQGLMTNEEAKQQNRGWKLIAYCY